MHRRDGLYLAVGVISLCGGLLVLAGVWQGDAATSAIGSGVLMMSAASLSALSASDDTA